MVFAATETMPTSATLVGQEYQNRHLQQQYTYPSPTNSYQYSSNTNNKSNSDNNLSSRQRSSSVCSERVSTRRMNKRSSRHSRSNSNDYKQNNNQSQQRQKPSSAKTTPMHDDTDAGRLIPVNQPALAIDYLGSSWKNEDDIAASWKFMTKQKHDMINGLRLENASWRNWAKQRHNLKTISPKVLNWLKDSDTTWLYGPLYKAAIDEFDLSRFGTQTVPNRSGSVTSSSSSIPSTTTVGADGKPKLKPVLKRKTASELFKADTLFHVQSDGRLNREIQPYSKATESAVFKEHRQPKLRFNDSVEQCVSIDNTDAIDEEDEDEDFWNLDGSRYRADNDDESSAGLTRRHEDEDGGILMRISAKKPLRSIVRIDPTRLKAASLHGMEDDDDDENQGFPEDATDEDEHEQEDSLFDESIYLANPYTTNGTGHSRSSSTQQYGVEHYERSYHDENDAAMGEISYTRPSPPSSSSDSRTQETAAERAAITTTAAAESDAGASKPEADNTAMTNGGFHQRAQSLVTNVKGLVHWASSFVYNNNNNHHQHP